ncbi:MAG: TonB-dependent receptor [Myxococcota bacterium]|nr:TonB-dependent receptor [Myxococcota bacterium]
MAGRSGGLSARVTGGYERTDPYVTAVDPERVDYGVAPVYDDPRTGYERTFFNLDARAELGPLSVRAGSAISLVTGSIQGVSRLREVPIGNILFAQSHLTVSSEVGLGLRVYWNRMTARADGVWESPPGALDTFGDVTQDAIDTEINFNRQFELGIPHNVSIGVGHRFKGMSWDWAIGDQTENHFFGYLQDALQLHDRLRFTASLRFDRHPLLDGIQFSPRGSLVWRFIDGNSLRFTGGTAFRSPAFIESYLDFENRTPLRGATAEAVGNTNLDPERIISFEVGYMNQATDYFALEANLYYNLVLDQISLSSVNPYELSDFGSGRAGYDERLGAYSLGTLQWNNDDATLRQLGGELGVRVFPVRGLDVYANYAIHDTSPRDDSDFQENPIRARDQRTSMHKINVGVQYRSPFGLDVNVDLHWVSDQRWVEQVTDTLRGVRFEEFPLDAYVMLNARLGYRLFDDHLEIGVTGTNLTFQKTRQHPLSQPVDTRIVGDVTLRF